MDVYDPARDYEPAIQLFRKCTRLPVHAHLRVAKATFWIVIGAVVILAVWKMGPLS